LVWVWSVSYREEMGAAELSVAVIDAAAARPGVNGCAHWYNGGPELA
jgi:hypothetical protein